MPTTDDPPLRRALLNWLKWALNMSESGTEAGTPRKGVFSYPGEVHAFLLGIGAVLHFITSGDVQLLVDLFNIAMLGNRARLRWTKAALIELKREPWYAIGGAVLTLLAWVAARVAMGQPPLPPELAGLLVVFA